MKSKRPAYPIPTYIRGIKRQALTLWDTVRSGNYPLERKVSIACGLAVGCHQDGDRAAAKRLLDWVRKQVPPDGSDDVRARATHLASLVSVLWHLGQHREAERLAEKLPDGRREAFYDIASHECRRRKEYASGWKLARRFKACYHRVLYLWSAMQADPAGRVPSLDVPRLLKDAIPGKDEDRILASYALWLKARCWHRLGCDDQAQKDLERALAVLDAQAEDDGSGPATLGRRLVLAGTCFELGFTDRGKALLEICRREFRAKTSKSRKAEDRRKYMEEGLATLAGLELRYGDANAAAVLEGSAPDDKIRDAVRMSLATVYFDQRRFKQAIAIIGQVSDAGSRIRRFGDIAYECRKGKLLIIAQQAVQGAVKAAKEVRRPLHWLYLSRVFVKLCERRRAVDCLRMAVSCLPKEEPSRGIEQWMLIKAYCQAGQYYKALMLAGEVADPLQRLHSLVTVWSEYHDEVQTANH